MESETNIRDDLAQETGKSALDLPHADPAMEAMCREAATTGMVLLKNDGVLPLSKDVPTAFFGRTQRDYFYVGYGSGGDVIPNYLASPMEAVENRRFCHDRSLAEAYARWCAQHPPQAGQWGQWPSCHPEMPVTEDMVRSARENCECAVIFLGRATGEAMDNRLEAGYYYLTSQERLLLKLVTAQFSRCAVVVNAGNIIDLSWLEEYPVSALLYAFHGGMESGNALVDLLYGDAQPSGRLADTIARRYEDYPSSSYFGDEVSNEYREDIYVGYRYFETFAPERVLFPFGFGLSYTGFSLRPRQTGALELTVSVTNTGSRPGQETVQVYVAPPQGLLGKPSRNLVAFRKTELLAPGQCQALTFPLDSRDFASFDDTGITGFPHAWVLESGDYGLYVGTDVRSAALAGHWPLEKTRLVESSSSIAGPAESFPRLVPQEDGVPFGKGWAAVPPCPASREELRLPQPIPMTPDRGIRLEQVARGEYSLEDFVSQLTPRELEALTRGEGAMDSPWGTPGNAGMLGGTISSLRDKGVPPLVTTDGPAGLRLRRHTALLPCGTALACSWEPEKAEALGHLFGLEMARLGSHILLGPGMNIHRDPLCGRNFEYFSEDPLLTGKLAAAMVRGIQSVPGRAACVKHFACNNQEAGREYTDSRVSQRALREIYLKGFSLCVKEAAPLILMTSYNKINGTWGHYHRQLVTRLLREEWGYRGLVITDWWMRPAQDPDFPALKNDAYRVRAGVDVLMPGGISFEDSSGDGSLLESYAQPNGITLGEMQQSALRVLKLCLRLHWDRNTAE